MRKTIIFRFNHAGKTVCIAYNSKLKPNGNPNAHLILTQISIVKCK